MAWITQGRFGVDGTTPRQLEHLGASDRGIILYRNALSAAIDAVARGEDPPGLVYDEATNDSLAIRGEHEMGGSPQSFRLPGQAVRAQTF